MNRSHYQKIADAEVADRIALRHPTNNLCRDLPARLVQHIEPTPLIVHGKIRSAQGRLPEDERDWPIWVRVASHIGLALMLIATCALWSCDPMGAAAGCGPSVCVMQIGE